MLGNRPPWLVAFGPLLAVLAVACGGEARADAEIRAQDRLALDQLREAGADLAKPRLVEHFLVFDDRAGAEAAGRGASSEGYAVSEVAEVERAWWLTLTARQVLTVETLADARAELDAIAEEHGGAYDGWGTEP
jgi:regulator of RNase E activity RraB